MKIHRLWVNNALRNYHYIVECETTKDAVVFDPFDVDLIMQCVEKNNLNVKAIINTHEHADHVQGNGELKQKTGAPIYAPKFDIFKDADVFVDEGDEIRVGEELLFYSYFTPGHTLRHFSYLLFDNDKPYLFAGDTIFNAGAGNTHSGSSEVLYDTFKNVLPVFSDKTSIYNGHDLFESNLAFALSVEPENLMIQKKLDEISAQSPENRTIATLGEEKTYNPFCRLDSIAIKNHLIEQGYLKQINAENEKAVFVALRQARDNW